MNRFAITLAVLLAGLASAAWALDPTGRGKPEDPALQPRGVPDYAAKPLPELKGVVSWKTLAEVTPVKRKDRFVPDFSAQIRALDRKEVRLQGFLLPLEPGDKQKHFILTSVPPTCAFCLPAGPDGLVEVKAKTPVRFSLEPVVVTGRFAVLRDDPQGLYYRLTDATPVGK